MIPPADTHRSRRWHSRRRSLLKAVSWRVSGSIATMAAVWFITHEWQLSLAFGSLEAAAKVLLFYVHERLWERVGGGARQ